MGKGYCIGQKVAKGVFVLGDRMIPPIYSGICQKCMFITQGDRNKLCEHGSLNSGLDTFQT